MRAIKAHICTKRSSSWEPPSPPPSPQIVHVLPPGSYKQRVSFSITLANANWNFKSVLFLALCSHRPWLWLTPSSIIALSPGTWIWWQSRVSRLSRLLSSSVKQFSRSLCDKEDDILHCIAWPLKFRSVDIRVLEITKVSLLLLSVKGVNNKSNWQGPACIFHVSTLWTRSQDLQSVVLTGIPIHIDIDWCCWCWCSSSSSCLVICQGVSHKCCPAWGTEGVAWDRFPRRGSLT